MIALASTVFLTLTASLFTGTQPDTGPASDTVHFRQVFADTVQGIQFTSDISIDRRIRLSLRGKSLDKPIVTEWMSTDTIGQWLDVVYKASITHELALTGEPSECEVNDDMVIPKDSLAGHIFALGSSIAVTPISVRRVPIYKIDVMEADHDHTATLGVTSRERVRVVHVLALAVKAARALLGMHR